MPGARRLNRSAQRDEDAGSPFSACLLPMFQPSHHVARFILIGLYTGTRHEANLNMRWGVNSKGGWFDVVMYRRGEGEIDTNKRRVPAPIPDRPLPHLKR
jgi:predicted fused transcriptional regulator/phosphomethylpyrimidine kinase